LVLLQEHITMHGPLNVKKRWTVQGQNPGRGKKSLYSPKRLGLLSVPATLAFNG